jgi:hypothetical protein
MIRHQSTVVTMIPRGHSATYISLPHHTEVRTIDEEEEETGTTFPAESSAPATVARIASAAMQRCGRPSKPRMQGM